KTRAPLRAIAARERIAREAATGRSIEPKRALVGSGGLRSCGRSIALGAERRVRSLRRAALEPTIGQIAGRQAPEIDQRAQAQHDPGIAQQQRHEQHYYDEYRQHHVARPPGPVPPSETIR